jgi:uncharacterized protein YuzE
MDKRMQYFPEEDILHVLVKAGDEANSVEISPHVTAELDASGDIIGIEITDATAYIRDTILESAQARLVQPKED